MFSMHIGISLPQPALTSWSILILGKKPLTLKSISTTIPTFRRDQKRGGKNAGPCHPPRNIVTKKAEYASSLTYAANWERPQAIPEYSVVHPDTSSLSASGMSNGILSNSAIIPAKKTIADKGAKSMNHTLACADAIAVKEKLPASMTAGRAARNSGTS